MRCQFDIEPDAEALADPLVEPLLPAEPWPWPIVTILLEIPLLGVVMVPDVEPLVEVEPLCEP